MGISYDDAKSIARNTLQWLIDTYTETGPNVDELHECLNDIKNARIEDVCCELCSEIVCDSNCPLKGFREQ